MIPFCYVMGAHWCLSGMNSLNSTYKLDVSLIQPWISSIWIWNWLISFHELSWARHLGPDEPSWWALVNFDWIIQLETWCLCFVRIHLLENGNRKTSIAALVKVSSKLPFFTVSEITLTNTGITLAFTGITITFTGITLTFTLT